MRAVASVLVILSLSACGTEPPSGLDAVEVSSEGLPPATHNAVLDTHNIPTAMAPGEVTTVRITVRNTGGSSPTDTWPGDRTYRLQSTNRPASLWGWTRSVVAFPVAVNGTYTFDLVLVAPNVVNPNAQFRARMHIAGAGGGFFGPELVVPISIAPNATRRWGCSAPSSTVAATMNAGWSSTVQVTVQNSGTETWQAGSLCFRATGTQWGRDVCPRLTSSVPPGGTHTFNIVATAPSAPGTYTFSRQMFALGAPSPTGGFGLLDRAQSCFSQAVTVVDPPSPQKDAEVVSHTFPSSLEPNQPFDVAVVVRNTGGEAWIPGAFFLSSTSSPRGFWGRASRGLSSVLNPGEDATIVLSLRAPGMEGTYNHAWRMQKATNPGAGFFGEALSVPVTLACGAGYYLSSGVCVPLTYAWDASSFGACGGGAGTFSYGDYEACTGGSGSWQYTDFGSCSAAVCAGSGTRTRSATGCAFDVGSGTEIRSASCDWVASSGTQTRTVLCRDNLGRAVADGFCTAAKPSELQNCTPSGVASCGGSPATSRSCTPTNTSVCGAQVLSEACSSPAGTRGCVVNNGTGDESCASGSTSWGACTITSCNTSFHLESGACVSDTRTCVVSNGSGSQTWSGESWGACTVTSCNTSFHLESGACVSDTRACVVSNGSGSQTWSGGSWGTCIAASCEAGFSLDSSSNTCKQVLIAFLAPPPRTDATRFSAIGALSNWDSICQSHATSAGRSGTFRAWLSNSTTDAITRLALPAAAQIRSPSGVLIANDPADLTDGSLINPIIEFASGSSAWNGSSYALGQVYTGTRATGLRASTSSAYHCANWSYTASSWSYRALVGRVGATDSEWTSTTMYQPLYGDEWGFCDWLHVSGFYCFQVGP